MNEMGRKKESTPGENLAKQIIEQYNPKSVADMQDALLKLLYLRITELYKSGTTARFKTGQWSEINSQQTKKSVPVSKNTSTRFELFMQGYFVSLRSTSYPCINLNLKLFKKNLHTFIDKADMDGTHRRYGAIRR